MDTNNELLQAIGQMMDDKLSAALAPINTRLNGIDERLDYLQGDVTALKADMAHHNHTVEPQLKIIREGLEGWGERAKQIDRHEDKIENQGNRIFALEYAFKTK